MNDDIIADASVIYLTTVLVVCFLMMFCGCSPAPSPPDTFAIDPDFTSGESETIRASIDDWCEAVGWCPEETFDLKERGAFIRTFTTGQCDGCVGYNDTWRIVLAPEGHLDMLWTMAAHEIGHWCAPEGSGIDGLGHTRDGLMAAKHLGPVLSIDYRAIRAWRAGCN